MGDWLAYVPLGCPAGFAQVIHRQLVHIGKLLRFGWWLGGAVA